MIEDGLGKAVDGFGSGQPVAILTSVIILLLIANYLVYWFLNALRKEAEAKVVKLEDRLEKLQAEQRDEYRNMSHMTKALEGLGDKVGDLQREQAILRESYRARS